MTADAPDVFVAKRPLTWVTSFAGVEPREFWNFSALVVAQVVVALVGLASTRFLTPSDKGLFTAVYLWALVGQTFVGLSLPNALLFYGTSEGRARPSRQVVSLLGSTSLLCGVALAFFVKIHSPDHLLLEFVLIPLPTAMLAFEVTTYSALAQGRPFFGYRLAQAMVFAVVGVPALVLTHNATLLTAILLLSYLVSVSIAVWVPRRSAAIKSPLRLGVRQLLQWSLRGHAGLTLSLLATRLDILFVTLLLSTFVAGQYAAAAALPNLLAYSGTALGLSLARRATAQSKGKTPGFAAWWGALLFMITAGIATILIGTRSQLITGLFGAPYAPASDILIPLAVSLPFWSLAAYEAQMLASVGRPIHQTIGQGIATLVLGIGSAYGVAHQNVQFVAWSNVAAYSCSVAWQSAALSLSRPR